MLYVWIVTVASLLLSAVVTLVSGGNAFTILAFTALAVATVVLMDAITATVCRLLPKKWANHEKKIFQVSAKEKKFYEKLNIRKWKDKIPEIGQFTGFRKNKLDEPNNLQYVNRFLLESCYGEIGHTVSCFAGFAVLGLFFITPLWWGIAIPVAIVNAIMNLPSLFILRYNSYKLEILRKSIIKKQEKQGA